jgi:hypothetical protein
MSSELGRVYIFAFIYYIILLNAALLFFARPTFLERFSFGFGTIRTRASLGVLLFITSFLLGTITYIFRIFNGMLVL